MKKSGSFEEAHQSHSKDIFGTEKDSHLIDEDKNKYDKPTSEVQNLNLIGMKKESSETTNKRVNYSQVGTESFLKMKIIWKHVTKFANKMKSFSSRNRFWKAQTWLLEIIGDYSFNFPIFSF